MIDRGMFVDGSQTRVEAAYMVDIDELAWLATPESLTDHLASLGHRRVCLVLVERRDLRFTLVIDPGWAEFASDVRRHDPHLIEELSLPRSVVASVVDRWPADWLAHHGHDLEIERGTDGVPHVSFGAVQN